MDQRSRFSRSGRFHNISQRDDSSQTPQDPSRSDSWKKPNTHLNLLAQSQKTETQSERTQLDHDGEETLSSPTILTSRVQISSVLTPHHQASNKSTATHQNKPKNYNTQIQGSNSSPFIPDFVSTPTHLVEGKVRKKHKHTRISGSHVASVADMKGKTKGGPKPVPVPIDPRLTDSFVKLQQNLARQKAEQAEQALNSRERTFISRVSSSEDDDGRDESNSPSEDNSSPNSDSGSGSSSNTTGSDISGPDDNSAALSTGRKETADIEHEKKHGKQEQKKKRKDDMKRLKHKDTTRKKKPYREEGDVKAGHEIQERLNENATFNDATDTSISRIKNKPIIPLYTSRNQRPTSVPITQTEQEAILTSARELEASLSTSLKSIIPSHVLSHATIVVKKSLNKTAKKKHNKLPFPDISNNDDTHDRDEGREETGLHTDAATLKAAYTLILQLSGYHLNQSSSSPISYSTPAFCAANQDMQSDLARIATERMTRITQLETEVHGLKRALQARMDVDEQSSTEHEDDTESRNKKIKRSRKI